MPWPVIARKEFDTSKNSRFVRYLLYFLVFVLLVGGYIFPVVTGGDVTTDRFAGFMTGSVGLLLPLLGLLLGYNAIVGERQSGRLTLVLSQPHTRREVVVGKLLGRGAVITIGVVGGLAVAGVLVIYPFGLEHVGTDLETLASLARYVAYIVVTLLFGFLFFHLGLALSTFTSSKQLATMGAFVVYFLFVIIWDVILEAAVFGLEQAGVTDGGEPDWLLFVHGAEPVSLYDRIVAGFFENDTTGPYLGADAPWYLGEWVALVLFLVWTAVPLLAGYYRFEVTDL